MSPKAKTELLILGVYPETDGYPNIKYRLADLLNAAEFSCSVIHAAIWPQHIATAKNSNRIGLLWRICQAHAQVLWRYCRKPTVSRVYVPYPAVLISWLLSWLPRQCQPEYLFLDAFISLYDTIVCDRKLLSASNPLAKVLFLLERRAYRHSYQVIVDTPQNADYFSELFDLPRTRFVAIPLSTYEATTPPLPERSTAPRALRVLFIGTLIPLHGIEVILAAIALLADSPHIQFKMIGSGQLTPLVRQFLQQHAGQAHLTWVDTWLSQEALVTEVYQADICLGIFGSTPKTTRVCPLKLYTYAACGRPIITADTACMQALQCQDAMILVRPGCAEDLAAAILHLSRHPERLSHYALASRTFYQAQLSNTIAFAQLSALMQAQ